MLDINYTTTYTFYRQMHDTNDTKDLNLVGDSIILHKACILWGFCGVVSIFCASPHLPQTFLGILHYHKKKVFVHAGEKNYEISPSNMAW